MGRRIWLFETPPGNFPGDLADYFRSEKVRKHLENPPPKGTTKLITAEESEKLAANLKLLKNMQLYKLCGLNCFARIEGLVRMIMKTQNNPRLYLSRREKGYVVVNALKKKGADIDGNDVNTALQREAQIEDRSSNPFPW